MIRYINRIKTQFFLFFVTASLFFAFRKDSVGTDSLAYANYFIDAAQKDGIQTPKFEIGYRLFMELIGIFTSSPIVFFFVIALLISMLLYSSYKSASIGNRIHHDIFYVSFLLVSAWYVTEVTNGIRQGIALSILYWAIFTQLRDSNYIKFLLLFFLSVSFHLSVLLTLPFFILIKLSLKGLSYIWLLTLFFYILGFNELIVATLSQALNIEIYDIIKYYGVSDVTELDSARWLGLQWDFLIYTVFFGMLSMGVFFFKKNELINRESFAFIIKVYLIMSLVYFVFGFGPYSNRYAVMAWFFLPFLQIAVMIQIKLSLNSLNALATLLPIIAISYFLFIRLHWLDYFQL
jgi:hypothetical protein